MSRELPAERRVLVTGATGFVGRTLCQHLAQSGYRVRAALRGTGPVPDGAAESQTVGDIGGHTDWSAALNNVDLVIHLASRVHVMNESAIQARAHFETNEFGTQRLAEAAAECGVERFIYLSTVKVNGEESTRPYAVADLPRPSGHYAQSKWLAEQRLAEIAAARRLPVAIVRPPLVYGPGVKANFLRLMRWVHQGRPIPLGAIDNRRSLVSVWNLCDLLQRLLEHPDAAGRSWMVSDGRDLSTPELIRSIALAMGRPAKLWPVPPAVLEWLGGLAGKTAEIERLCGSLVVDIEDTRRELEWKPPLSVEEGIARTVRWYLSKRGPN